MMDSLLYRDYVKALTRHLRRGSMSFSQPILILTVARMDKVPGFERGSTWLFPKIGYF